MKLLVILGTFALLNLSCIPMNIYLKKKLQKNDKKIVKIRDRFRK